MAFVTPEGAKITTVRIPRASKLRAYKRTPEGYVFTVPQTPVAEPPRFAGPND